MLKFLQHCLLSSVQEALQRQFKATLSGAVSTTSLRYEVGGVSLDCLYMHVPLAQRCVYSPIASCNPVWYINAIRLFLRLYAIKSVHIIMKEGFSKDWWPSVEDGLFVYFYAHKVAILVRTRNVVGKINIYSSKNYTKCLKRYEKKYTFSIRCYGIQKQNDWLCTNCCIHCSIFAITTQCHSTPTARHITSGQADPIRESSACSNCRRLCVRKRARALLTLTFPQFISQRPQAVCASEAFSRTFPTNRWKISRTVLCREEKNKFNETWSPIIA